MIHISHTPAEGTLITGTERGDGAGDVLNRYAKWSRSLECWLIRHSRDKLANRRRIDALADALRAAGFEVEVSIDDTATRSFEERVTEDAARAEARAERFTGYAANAARNSDALYEAHMDMVERIPVGQPILVGHHSEKRDRRFRERAHNKLVASVDEAKRAKHWQQRAAAAGGNVERFSNVGQVMRRIDKVEADIRSMNRKMGTATEGSEYRDRLVILLGIATDERDYLRARLAELEAEGQKAWGPADFKPGAFARCRGRWYEVIRVNKKSLTIPAAANDGRVITVAGSRLSWTDRLPYDDVSGHAVAADAITE